jgi:transcriptional regulator with XRE-family HTH domain
MKPNEIKKIRKSAGMTQSQLAEYLGYGSQTRISEIEHGNRKPGAAVIKLLEMLRDKSQG